MDKKMTYNAPRSRTDGSGVGSISAHTDQVLDIWDAYPGLFDEFSGDFGIGVLVGVEAVDEVESEANLRERGGSDNGWEEREEKQQLGHRKC